MAGCANMRAPASRKIKLRDVDQAQVARLLRRKLTQAELPCFFQRHKADAYRTVFSNHLIGQQLRSPRLYNGQPSSFQINSAAFLAHVEADGWHIEKPDERSG